MRVTIKELSEIFKVSPTKIHTIIGRAEFDKFHLKKINRKIYFELNEYSGKLLEKWVKPRTKKGGYYER